MNEKLKAWQEARKGGCWFMSERDKAKFDELEGRTVELQDAYKIHREDGDFWAFIVLEEPDVFYFANTSLGIILDDAAQLAEEDGQTIAEMIASTRIFIGALQEGKRGRKFRPVDIVD